VEERSDAVEAPIQNDQLGSILFSPLAHGLDVLLLVQIQVTLDELGKAGIVLHIPIDAEKEPVKGRRISINRPI